MGDLRTIQYFCPHEVKFLLGLTVVMTVATLLVQLFTFGYFGQMIGLVSLCTEAMLGLPQIYSNFRNKSVEGLSVQMIMMWFLGDFCKTVYFIANVTTKIFRPHPFSFYSAESSNFQWTSSSWPRSFSTASKRTTTRSINDSC